MKFYLKTCLFLTYLFSLSWLLFISVGSTDRSKHFHNPDDHFIPFYSTYMMFKTAIKYRFNGQPGYALVTNILGNIVLFIPWGILVPQIFKTIKSTKAVIIFSMTFSLACELVQHVYSIGIFDIDDIIYNTIGGIIGFKLIKHFSKQKTHREHYVL